MITTIRIVDHTGEFAENKDAAANLRENYIRPSINAGEEIVIDFSWVNLTTQSFIHALISDILRKRGETALDIITFKGCSELVRELIETVVQYSLESIEET